MRNRSTLHWARSQKCWRPVPYDAMTRAMKAGGCSPKAGEWEEISKAGRSPTKSGYLEPLIQYRSGCSPIMPGCRQVSDLRIQDSELTIPDKKKEVKPYTNSTTFTHDTTLHDPVVQVCGCSPIMPGGWQISDLRIQDRPLQSHNIVHIIVHVWINDPIVHVCGCSPIMPGCRQINDLRIQDSQLTIPDKKNSKGVYVHNMYIYAWTYDPLCVCVCVDVVQ